MKKKHELLKHAYDNYPKGTIATWGGTSFETTGVYTVSEFQGILLIRDSKENDIYYGGWAEIIPETKSKPLLTSMDGVDLFEGDSCWIPQHKSSGNDKYYPIPAEFEVDGFDPLPTAHYFKSKESALTWIENQNKPKVVEVQLFNKFHSAKISNKWVAIRVGKVDSNTTTMFKPSDIQKMYHALKQLQS